MIASGTITTPGGSEKFASAVKHLNVMYATRQAKIALVRDPIERAVRETELRRVVMTARGTLSKIHDVFEGIGADVISSSQ